MSAETDGKWVPTTVRAECKLGPKEVPAVTNSLIPGLAVTMVNFGEFEVTHVLTGRRVVGPFERFWNATLAACHLALCADFSGSVADLRTLLTDSWGDEPCGDDQCTITSGGVARMMTKRELFKSTTLPRWEGDEFPWEGDDSPAEAASKILDLLKAKAVA